MRSELFGRRRNLCNRLRQLAIGDDPLPFTLVEDRSEALVVELTGPVVVVRCLEVRRIEVKQRIGAVISLYDLLEVLVLDGHVLEPFNDFVQAVRASPQRACLVSLDRRLESGVTVDLCAVLSVSQVEPPPGALNIVFGPVAVVEGSRPFLMQLPRVRCCTKPLLKLFATVANDLEKVDDVAVQVVVDLNVARWFVQENRSTPAEHFDVPPMFGEVADNLVDEGRLPARIREC